MHLAIFLDILTPIKVLSLTTQQEVHDPVNTIKRINEFSWTMTKLKSSEKTYQFYKISERSNFDRKWEV